MSSNASENHNNLISPNLQHIIDNHPMLNINDVYSFPHDNAIITDNESYNSFNQYQTLILFYQNWLQNSVSMNN